MNSGRDDDALSWDGDDDPTLDVGASAVEQAEPVESVAAAASTPADPVALPKGYNAVGKDAETVGLITADGTVTMPGDRAPMGNAALIATGVLGGVYLIYVIGWIIGGLRLQGTAVFLVSPVVYQVSLWLAILAAPLWFGVTLLLTRNGRTWVRIAWLVAGAVLLVPWPFFMTGAIGQ